MFVLPSITSLTEVTVENTLLISEKNCNTLNMIQCSLDIIGKTLEDKEIQIIGGSACAILDHLYQNKPLFLRDLDLAVIMHQCITTEETKAIADELQFKIPGILNFDYLEDRPRIPKELPFKKGEVYFSAGKGFFLHPRCQELPILDLTLYYHHEDLLLNGIFQQDRISIVLNKERSFAQFIEEAHKNSIEQLIANEWVQQPHGAYQNWTQGKMELTNWEEISLRPHLSALRIVRSLNKKGVLPLLTTPSAVRNDLQKQWKDLNQAISSNSCMEYGFQSRLFQRCLKDSARALELKALCHAGVFDQWLPFLNIAISWLSVDEIEKLLSLNSATTIDQKLLNLVNDQPLMQQVHTLFFAFGGPENLSISAKKVWERLEDSFEEFGQVDQSVCDRLIKSRCEEDEKKFSKCVSRIIASSSLQENEKLTLLLRTLITGFEDLEALFPYANRDKLSACWEDASKQRIGFFTGVFDPLINTHVQIIAHAIEQMHLDQVIVAPVYLSRKINRPCQPWNDRRSMAIEGLQIIPEVKVVDKNYKSKLKISIQTAFSDFKEKNNADWIHISGEDAFKRFIHLGRMDQYLAERIRIFVVKRIGIASTLVPPKYATLVSRFDPSIPLGILGGFSAHDVREKVKGGQNISGLVPQKVEEYIRQHSLYCSQHPAMQMPWQIQAPEALASLIHQQLPFANISSGQVYNTEPNDLLVNLSRENSRPALIFQIKDHPEGKCVTLAYQHSLSDAPIIMERLCTANQIEKTGSHLLQTLIHHVIGHSGSISNTNSIIS